MFTTYNFKHSARPCYLLIFFSSLIAASARLIGRKIPGKGTRYTRAGLAILLEYARAYRNGHVVAARLWITNSSARIPARFATHSVSRRITRNAAIYDRSRIDRRASLFRPTSSGRVSHTSYGGERRVCVRLSVCCCVHTAILDAHIVVDSVAIVDVHGEIVLSKQGHRTHVVRSSIRKVQGRANPVLVQRVYRRLVPFAPRRLVGSCDAIAIKDGDIRSKKRFADARENEGRCYVKLLAVRETTVP